MSASDDLIREARSEDAAELAQLGRRTARAWFADVYTDEELQAFLRRDFREDVLRSQIESPLLHTFLIHELKGQPSGFARLNWHKPIPLTEDSGAELQKIYYLPQCTGKGLGRKLMAAVIATVAARGEKLLWLDVLDNNPRARDFYQELGFEILGAKPFATGRGEIGMHVLRLRIDQSARCA